MINIKRNKQQKQEIIIDKQKKKEWNITNAQTKYALFKTIGEAIAEKFDTEVPLINIYKNKTLLFTSSNGTQFTISITQKRKKNNIDYRENNIEDIFEKPKDYNEEEWLKELQNVMQ